MKNMSRLARLASYSVLMAALLTTGLAGCGGMNSPGGSGGDSQPAQTIAVDERLAAANSRFAINLLKEVGREKPGQNLFLSPASASVILTLTANGAKGETQQQMLTALGYQEMELDEINQANGSFPALLANPAPQVELSVANAIWYAEGLKVAPAFARAAQETYRAEVHPTTFGAAKSVKAINGWVDKQTKGRIPELVDETDPADVMWLVNALYFKGAWREPFDPKMTQEGSFYKLDGATKKVSFMHKTDSYGYLEAEGIRGVRLPYGKEGNLSFYALMPDRWEGFVAGLTAERWEGWLKGFRARQVQLALPKVKLEFQAELLEPLRAMGMELATTPGRADFTGLFTTPEDLFIARVIQKTFLEINEEGTEAAAATGVGVETSSAPSEPPPQLTLDHPFLLAIRDDRTGVVLFMGAVLEP